jgi:hypothetical protein
VVAADQ